MERPCQHRVNTCPSRCSKCVMRPDHPQSGDVSVRSLCCSTPPGALGLFRKGLDEWGTAGLKLHPASGFFPYDPVCLPFFDLAGQRGVPVLVHTGPMVAPLLSRMAQPVHLDEVAADFPQTTIIMAHVGLCWWEEALSIAWHKPNVVLERTCLSPAPWLVRTPAPWDSFRLTACPPVTLCSGAVRGG